MSEARLSHDAKKENPKSITVDHVSWLQFELYRVIKGYQSTRKKYAGDIKKLEGFVADLTLKPGQSSDLKSLFINVIQGVQALVLKSPLYKASNENFKNLVDKINAEPHKHSFHRSIMRILVHAQEIFSQLPEKEKLSVDTFKIPLPDTPIKFTELAELKIDVDDLVKKVRERIEGEIQLSLCAQADEIFGVNFETIQRRRDLLIEHTDAPEGDIQKTMLVLAGEQFKTREMQQLIQQTENESENLIWSIMFLNLIKQLQRISNQTNYPDLNKSLHNLNQFFLANILSPKDAYFETLLEMIRIKKDAEASKSWFFAKSNSPEYSQLKNALENLLKQKALVESIPPEQQALTEDEYLTPETDKLKKTIESLRFKG